jgi:xylulokinase
MLCLGLASGTTACKGLVLDTDSGKILAQASAPHPFVEGLPPGHVEQEPQIWSDAADQVILACLEKIGARRSEVVAFGVSAQEHGLSTLDERNEPVRPAKLWCDTSTAEQAEKLRHRIQNHGWCRPRSGDSGRVDLLPNQR